VDRASQTGTLSAPALTQPAGRRSRLKWTGGSIQ
jgi:hypothetical protein